MVKMYIYVLLLRDRYLFKFVLLFHMPLDNINRTNFVK